MHPKIPHTLLWLVPALLFCLFRPAADDTAADLEAQCGGRFCTIVDRAADEFRCERVCNSDLDLPFAGCRHTAPVRSLTRPVRGGGAVARPVVRPASDGGRQLGMICAVSRYKRFRAVASGIPAVDFYVYRLCRLII